MNTQPLVGLLESGFRGLSVSFRALGLAVLIWIGHELLHAASEEHIQLVLFAAISLIVAGYVLLFVVLLIGLLVEWLFELPGRLTALPGKVRANKQEIIDLVLGTAVVTAWVVGGLVLLWAVTNVLGVALNPGAQG